MRHASRTASLAPFVATTALGSTAYIAAFTAASIAAREITGKAELSGLPSALGTIGTAGAIGLLAAIMSRRGRRTGLIGGFAVAVVGAIASVAAVVLAAFPLLLAGSILAGFGNAAIQLSRYAAADRVAPEQRAAAVGVVVWGSTAGAVLGPNLVAPAGAVASAVGRSALEGGLTVTVLGFALALLVVLVRVPRPDGTVDPARPPGDAAEANPEPAAVAPELVTRTEGLLAALAPIRVRVALVAMVTAQVVMVLIMTMTPVHIHDMGESLTTVGFVISAHTLGMFALSPITGRLVVRIGAFTVLYAGFAMLLVAAVLAAVARDPNIPVLVLALFLLGYGWNLAFVAGSSLLTSGASLRERIRLQGATDMLVFSAGAAASVSSGLLLDWAGYQTLAIVGGGFLALPAVVIFLAGRRIAAPARAGA